MNQKKFLSSSKKLILPALLLAVSSQVTHAVTFADWSGTPIVVTDKTYTFIGSSNNLFNNASAQGQLNGLVHSFDLTSLANAVSGDFVLYSITITDPTNFFSASRVSQNDVLGNVTAGTTTKIYSGWDGFVLSGLLNTTTLTGTQVGPQQAISGQTIYVETQMFGIDTSNNLASVNLDVVQTNDLTTIPEVASSFSLLGLISGGLMLRRRSRGA